MAIGATWSSAHLARGVIRLEDIIGVARLADWHAYLEKCQVAFDCLMTSRSVPPPGDFAICQDDISSWARPFVWDCENPADCSPVLRSSRETVFEGEKQVDGSGGPRVAERLCWDQVDPDIVQQVCEGGAELRSEAPLHTTACWHHPGLLEHFATADACVWIAVALCALRVQPPGCSAARTISAAE